jgi:hypothetical protein
MENNGDGEKKLKTVRVPKNILAAGDFEKC